MTLMGTVTGQGRVWPLYVRDLGLLVDAKALQTEPEV